MSGMKYARIFYAKRAENTKIKTKLVKSINRKYKQERRSTLASDSIWLRRFSGRMGSECGWKIQKTGCA